MAKPSLKRGPRNGEGDTSRSPHKSGPRGGGVSTQSVSVVADVIIPAVEQETVTHDVTSHEPVVEAVVIVDNEVPNPTPVSAEQKNKKKTI